MIPLLAAILDDSAFRDIVDIVAVAPSGNNDDAHQLRDVLFHKYRISSNAKDERNSGDHVRDELRSTGSSPYQA